MAVKSVCEQIEDAKNEGWADGFGAGITTTIIVGLLIWGLVAFIGWRIEEHNIQEARLERIENELRLRGMMDSMTYELVDVKTGEVKTYKY